MNTKLSMRFIGQTALLGSFFLLPMGVGLAGNPASQEYVLSQIAKIPLIAAGGTTGQLLAKNSNANYDTTWVNPPTVNPTTVYTVGQQAMGGIVFYVDSTGVHGLIAASTETITNQTWDGGGNDFVTGANGNGIGAGKMNTSLIVSEQNVNAVTSSALTNMAAQACVNYSIQTDGVTPCSNPGSVAGASCYADWYLPSIFELNQMYLSNGIPDFGSSPNDAFLWSSTENDAGTAYRQNVSFSSASLLANKSDASGVWCIRSF
ncbi:MAG: hypothetical protein ACHP65_08630 [Legionellales bacterium]